jgi:hypothetical protein
VWCIVSLKKGLRVYESRVHAEPVTERRPQTPRYASIVINKLVLSFSFSLFGRTTDVRANHVLATRPSGEWGYITRCWAVRAKRRCYPTGRSTSVSC